MALMVGDTMIVVASFILALIFRLTVDSRPYYFHPNLFEFAAAIIVTIPIWIFIFVSLRLYDVVRLSKLSEFFRLIIASILGTIFIIAIDFFLEFGMFPSRSVAIYATIICFVLLNLERSTFRLIEKIVHSKNRAITRVLVVGGNDTVTRILSELANKPAFKVVSIVAPAKYIPETYKKYRVSSIKSATKTNPDIIYHTDSDRIEYLFKQCVEHHWLYRFVPPETSLSQHLGRLMFLGTVPTVSVNVTPLLGMHRVLKRLFDIVFGMILLILALIPMALIWTILKISDCHTKPIYRQTRLSAFNKEIIIYKFRSMKPEYCGLSPERAFKKLEKKGIIFSAEETAKAYRDNGDFLNDDPRITKIGSFLRKTSLDELPQLINVIKGDISLVGPRALVPGELRHYGDRSLLLSVKAGLTGLAQVSGRRELSFSERRALDLYYIQNWSLALDFEILFRTIIAVIRRKGAG